MAHHPKPTWRGLEHLPGDWGLPVLGHTLDVLLRGEMTYWRSTFLPDFAPYRTSVFGECSVGFAGPEAAQAMLGDPDRCMSSEGGWDHTLGRHFHGGLMLRDGDDHRAHRRVMNRTFSRAALAGYVETLTSCHARCVAALSGAPFDPWVALKTPLLDAATRVFLGDDSDDLDAINAAFLDVMGCITALFRVPLPGTAWARADRGRQQLVTAYQQAIAARRAAPGPDLLSRLLERADDDDPLLDDDTIVDHLVFLMMAAHDTTNSALSSTLVMLALHPEWQERVRAEVQGLSDHPSADELRALDLTHRVLRETVRLYPPVVAIPRRTMRPCTIAGVDLPANAQVWLNVAMTHRMPALWPDPERFDPDRFTEGRAEHKQHRFQYLPFGAGAHTCLGMAFAELSMSLFLVTLLQRGRLELPRDWTPRWGFLPFPRAKGPVPLRYLPA